MRLVVVVGDQTDITKGTSISVTRLKLNKYVLRWQVDEKSWFWGNYNINVEY